MVVCAQRCVKKFLAVRQAQLQIVYRLYELTAIKEQSMHECASHWLELPRSVKEHLVWGEVMSRRREHKRVTEEQQENALLNSAYNLIHGVPEEAQCVVFKVSQAAWAFGSAVSHLVP